MPDWLPRLVVLADYGGNWEKYVEALYAFFKADFVDSYPTFRGKKVAHRRLPVNEGKDAGFWHLISKGRVEADRTPDFDRCERIRWPRPTIEHSPEPEIKIWENERHNRTHVCIWLEEADYLIVLRKGELHYVLLTAYTVTYANRKRTLRSEYEAYIKSNDVPG